MDLTTKCFLDVAAHEKKQIKLVGGLLTFFILKPVRTTKI